MTTTMDDYQDGSINMFGSGTLTQSLQNVSEQSVRRDILNSLEECRTHQLMTNDKFRFYIN